MARWLKLNVESAADRIPETYEQIDKRSGVQVAGIIPDSICDGPGIRLTFFFQGCPHRCPACHNPETHGIAGGTFYTVSDLIAYMDRPLVQGITFSGGEPLAQAASVMSLAEAARKRGLNTILYTGYTFSQLTEWRLKNPTVARVLDLMDAVIDGPYIAALRDPDLRWRGSSNQRIIALTDEGAGIFDKDCERLNF